MVSCGSHDFGQNRMRRQHDNHDLPVAGISPSTGVLHEMLPALAQQLEMQPDELSGFIGENFPAMAGVMANMESTMGRFQGMVTSFDSNLDNYETLKPVKFVPIIWTLIVAGVGLVIFGAWGFVAAAKD